MLAEAMNVTTASIWAASGFSNAPIYSSESLSSLVSANNPALRATGSAIDLVITELEKQEE